MYTRLLTIVVSALFIVFGSSCGDTNEHSGTADVDAPLADAKETATSDNDNSKTVDVDASVADSKEAAIRDFWEKDEHSRHEFTSEASSSIPGVKIRYRIFERSSQKAAVVISSGRTECMFKYDETIYDLYQKGYSVYIHDHRGQGFSGRTIAMGQLPKEHSPGHGHGPGHVEDFRFYVQDLHQFVTSIVQKSQRKLTQSDQNLLLLGHSMGGCIASLYIEEHPKVFRAAVLCSPMHEPDLGLFPGIVAKTLSDLKALKGQAEEYATGGGPYKHNEFDKKTAKKSALTHSGERYTHIAEMFEQHKKTRVGGASFGWLRQAIGAAERAIDDAKNIKIDVLLLQATEDVAVTAEGQNKFRDALNAEQPGRCDLQPINGAYHELLIERDDFRNQAMDKILSFFAKHAADSGS